MVLSVLNNQLTYDESEDKYVGSESSIYELNLFGRNYNFR
jgi:hypothetical protein